MCYLLDPESYHRLHQSKLSECRHLLQLVGRSPMQSGKNLPGRLRERGPVYIQHTTGAKRKRTPLRRRVRVNHAAGRLSLSKGKPNRAKGLKLKYAFRMRVIIKKISISILFQQYFLHGNSLAQSPFRFKPTPHSEFRIDLRVP